jgi:hypothetical protein
MHEVVGGWERRLLQRHLVGVVLGLMMERGG